MGQPFLIDIFVQTTFADWCNVLERYLCSICATFWDVCELFVRYAWLGLKWWSLVEPSLSGSRLFYLSPCMKLPHCSCWLKFALLFVTSASKYLCWKQRENAAVRFAPFHVWNHHNWLKFARTLTPLCAKSNQTNIDQQRTALTRGGEGPTLMNFRGKVLIDKFTIPLPFPIFPLRWSHF